MNFNVALPDLEPEDEEGAAVKVLTGALVVTVCAAVVIGVFAFVDFGKPKGEKTLQGRQTVLREGTTLLTGKGGQVTALAESGVQITAGNGLYRLSLAKGRLKFVVPTLDSGFVFAVETDLATVTVKGTVFTVSYDGDRLEVSVAEGAVACASKEGVRDVRAGETHTVTRQAAGSPR